MGLTKQYLRYSPAGNVNIVTSDKCNSAFVTLEGQEGRFVATGACEHVYIWDLRLGEKVQVLSGEKTSVTRIAASPNKRLIAAGYADGVIKTFDLRSGELISSFKGHNSEITALAFDHLGHRLASGSKDTDIVIWDVVAESGVCRLVGHKGVVTQVAFMRNENVLLSSSKDTFIKFWDLDTEHNFKTLTGHRSEVWDFVLTKDDKYLMSGCNENVLHVWKIVNIEDNIKSSTNGTSLLNVEESEFDDSSGKLKCVRIQSIQRNSKGRVTSLKTDFSGQTVICQGTDNTYDLFYFCPDDQISKRQSKRKQKSESSANGIILRDEIKKLPTLSASSKGKSVDLVMGRNDELRICVCLNNNSIELHALIVTDKKPEIKCLRSITAHGHRTDVRAVAFSSDSQAFATVSGDSIKLWNRSSLACLRTVQCGYALSVTFVPGDRHLIVGLKSGHMLIVDISSGDILEDIAAHEKELWSLHLMPDQNGIASGGGDKTVKFWQFQLVEDPECKAKVLSVCHTRTLKLDEGVLCVKICPNSRFVAVSLLDSTVKIFFLDTFKFFLSLYGHKLPVLCMDISSDSALIATGSADRNIKIWGMDFGDCHKSLFAHDDSITGIAFVPRTHYFFSCGKDGKVKEWDADHYTKIVTLQGHLGEAWNCAVSPNGEYVLSCGSDKVVRMYTKTSEILVLEDEAEQEREDAANEAISEETTTVRGQKQQVLPTKKTLTSEKGAESILECLEISKQYMEQCAAIKPPQPLPPPPMIMKAYNCETAHDFLLQTVKSIRASDLDEALLLLPYSTVCEIIRMLPTLLKQKHHVEMTAKLAFAIIRMYHSQITTNKEIMIIVKQVEELVTKQLTELRDTVGYNLYGMSYIQRVIEDDEGIRLFKDATVNRRHKKKVKANKEKSLKRAIMAL